MIKLGIMKQLFRGMKDTPKIELHKSGVCNNTASCLGDLQPMLECLDSRSVWKEVWTCIGPVLEVVGIWGVNQRMEDTSQSFSLTSSLQVCLSNKLKIVSFFKKRFSFRRMQLEVDQVISILNIQKLRQQYHIR